MNEDSHRTLALMNETGYQIQQDNGQRIYGPPPNWIGPAPKDTEVFIGKLPNDVFEYDLVPILSSVGKIYLLRIMQNFSGLNRGFAFVQYTNSEDADKCIRLLNNTEIRPNEKIGVVKSRNNCRLYIGKLDQTLTKEEIIEELEKYTEDIVEVIIHKSDEPGLNNRGYAFVEYLTHKAAAKARRKLVPCKIKIRGVEISVDWATPIHESGENINVTCSLLIKNIKETLTNLDLCRFFSVRQSLKISKIKRLPNQVLIIFASRQLCETAMRVYLDLKSSKEFQLLASKNKRVEIIYLKNNIDLSSFLSAVDYSPPAFFPPPPTISSNPNSPSPPKVTQQINSTSSQITQQSNAVQLPVYSNASLQQNQSKSSINNVSQSTTTCHEDCRCSCRKSNALSNSFADTQQKLQNRIIVPNSFNVTNQLSNSAIAKHLNNPNSIPITSNNSNASMSNRLPINGHKQMNTLANRMPLLNQSNLTNINNNPFVNRSSASLGCQQASKPNTLANRNIPRPAPLQLPSLESPYFGNKSDVDVKDANNNLTANNDLINLSANLNNLRILNQTPINLPDRNLMLLNSFSNRLNDSYNFGIWRNDNNLDASSNWSSFTKMVKAQAANSFNSHLSAEASNRSISEDAYSIKSDQGALNFADNFSCFSSNNSLNLHDNFYNLTADKSLSSYPFYEPVLQSN